MASKIASLHSTPGARLVNEGFQVADAHRLIVMLLRSVLQAVAHTTQQWVCVNALDSQRLIKYATLPAGLQEFKCLSTQSLES